MTDDRHLDPDPSSGSAVERAVMVFVRDLERGLRNGRKTRARWVDGRFDDAPWREGPYRCDCARGALLYGGEGWACGRTRFVVERIVVWDTGETVYSECGLD